MRRTLQLLGVLDSACAQLRRYLWLVPRVERLELRVRLLEEASYGSTKSARQGSSTLLPDQPTSP